MHTACLVRIVLFAAVALMTAGGCSKSDLPDLAQVSGVVTLDGTPYPNAQVTFSPAQGRPSQGVTDSSGKYELTYLPGVKGAELGSHTVSISTQYQAPENPGDEPPFKEPIPAKYNVQSTLTQTVTKGANDANFDLKKK